MTTSSSRTDHAPDTTPREQIENRVLPVYRRLVGCITRHEVREANRRHGPTAQGRRSDHQGPGYYAYAVDLAIATGAQGHALAQRCRALFGFPVGNPGFNPAEWHDMTVQVLWNVEGHYDHVHVGLHRIGVFVPPPRWP